MVEFRLLIWGEGERYIEQQLKKLRWSDESEVKMSRGIRGHLGEDTSANAACSWEESPGSH